MGKLDIKGFREDRRWSQAKLAEIVGVHQATVWRWENGQDLPSWASKMMRHISLMHPPMKQGENA